MKTKGSKAAFTLRMVSRRAGESWVRLPTNRGTALLMGTARAPKWANQRVEVVSVQVRTNTTPHRLASACNLDCLFDENGMIDYEHAMAELRTKVDAPPVDGSVAEAPDVSGSDLKAICKLLKIDPPPKMAG